MSTSNDIRVPSAHHGQRCSVAGCGVRVIPGEEWGEHWTTDDSDNLYCADHNDLNPTSDTYSAGESRAVV